MKQHLIFPDDQFDPWGIETIKRSFTVTFGKTDTACTTLTKDYLCTQDIHPGCLFTCTKLRSGFSRQFGLIPMPGSIRFSWSRKRKRVNLASTFAMKIQNSKNPQSKSFRLKSGAIGEQNDSSIDTIKKIILQYKVGRTVYEFTR